MTSQARAMKQITPKNKAKEMHMTLGLPNQDTALQRPLGTGHHIEMRPADPVLFFCITNQSFAYNSS